MKRNLVKLAVVAAASVMITNAALARPNTVNMSCAAAHGIVMRSGAIVLSTGGGTFDRFVRHRGYCTPMEVTQPAFVPTRNNPQCFIGYTCEQFYNDDFPDRD